LILTVMMVGLLVVVGSALVSTRHLWGFSAAKQLDSVSIEMAARVDSSRWLSALRYQVQNAGMSFGGVSATEVVLGRVATFGFDNYVLDGKQMFGPSAAYPAVDSVNVAAPVLYSGAAVPSVGLGNDPYQGMISSGTTFSAVFGQEMTSVGRDLRVDRFSATQSKLRAWVSMDGQLDGVVSVRSIPLSVFTLFCPESVDGSAVDLNTGWLLGGSSAYSFPEAAPTYSSVTGIGRVYVEGGVSVSSAVRLGVPLVATRGMTFPGGPFYGVVPGTGVAFNFSPGSYDEFVRKRFTDLGGMVDLGEDAGCRLIRPGQVLIDGRWRVVEGGLGDMSSGFGAALYGASTRVRISQPSGVVSVIGYDPARFAGGVASEVAKIKSVGVWTLDLDKKEVLFHPPAGFFDTFLKAPLVLYAEVVNDSDGMVAADFKVRLQVGNVGALSAVIAKQKLTFYCARHPLILEDGFNTGGNEFGTMVVAPVIGVDGVTPSTGGLTFNVRGMVVTEAFSPRYPFVGTFATDVVRLTGGLVLWDRLSAARPGPLMAVRLIPDTGYMSGEKKIPEMVPAGTDIRYSQRRFQLYQLRKVSGSGSGPF
jgi:hypothetical protein